MAWPFTQLIVCHTGKSSPFSQLLANSDNLQLLRVQQRSQHLCLACRVLILTVVRPTRFRTNCFKDNTRSAILNTFTRIFPRKKVECFHSICNFTGSHAFKVVHKCKTERNISVLFTVLHPFRRITWFHLDRLRTKNEASSDRVRKVNKTRIRRFCALTCNFTR